MQERGPNFYSVLGVTRASNPLEIKRAYKKRSLELHPDKNPSPNAVEEFDRLKSAYDVRVVRPSPRLEIPRLCSLP